jgi:uncharacterized protein
MRAGDVAEFLIKITKHCNLRCSYCNEFAELGYTERMPLARIRRIFENIAAYAALDASQAITFTWHGGEPFLVPLSYYDAIAELQHEIFNGIPVVNGVQTNLTILTERHLEYLASNRFFTRLGVSFDPYGDQRVDLKGRLRTDQILNNIQRLIDHDIDFGALTVLARNTVAHARHIYHFFDRLGVSCKFVPFYLSSFSQQIVDHAIERNEIVHALSEVFDAWSSSVTATLVAPIDDYLESALAYITGRNDRRYDRGAHEYSVIVNLDGGVWAPNDTYFEKYRYGNLLDQDLQQILASPARALVVDEARRRQETYCGRCRYFGACPGIYVADASPQQQELLATSGCPVQGVIDHMIEVLDRSKIPELDRDPAPVVENFG